MQTVQTIDEATSYNRVGIIVWFGLSLSLGIIAGLYIILSFLQIVPLNAPIMAGWFGILLFVNSGMFYYLYRNWSRLGIRLRIITIMWSSIVYWFWLFSPLFYLLTMYSTQKQLRVVALNYFWEVPIFGGLYILVCMRCFHPLYSYLTGKRSKISSPQQAYLFLQRYALKTGFVLAGMVIFGYVVGSVQQVYLGELPFFGQLKLIFHGLVFGVLGGLYVALAIDRVLNSVRFKIKINNPTENFSTTGLTKKIYISFVSIIIASIGCLLLIGTKSYQDLVLGIVSNSLVANFDDISNDLMQSKQLHKGVVVNRFIGGRAEFFSVSGDFANNKLAPETVSYINLHQEGKIQDNNREIKVIVFRTNIKTLNKEIVVAWLSDYYFQFTKLIAPVVVTIFLIILFVFSTLTLFTGSIKNILNSINKIIGKNEDLSLKDGENLSTGDEFEILFDTIVNYKESLRQMNADLNKKVEEQTSELTRQLSEIEIKNKFLSDSKLAMQNVLEDAKELEEQLKVEKQNVEKKVEERTKSLMEAKDEISRGWMQLEKEKARLSSSITSLPLGFIMTDKDGNVVVSNPALEKILEFEGKKWTLSDITKGISGKMDVVASCLSSMKEKKTLEAKDIMFGSKYLRIFMTPIATEANEVLGAVILVEDVTEAKVLERSRDEFFSIASHELRTPLTSIKGNTSMIEDYYGDKLQDKELKEMIDDIHESSVRLIGIVNDFLDMSRLEQGRIEFKKEVFDTVPVVEHIVYDVAKLGNEKNIYVKFNEPSGVHPNVCADSARTKQIVYNLLGNSIKFTNQGGVTVSIENDEKMLNIRVTDTGQGIPLASQALLFRKFQQAENNILTRDGTQGTGLGLYISRLMAQGMGGEVILEKSEENKGSTFLFTLPLASKKDIEQFGVTKDKDLEDSTGPTGTVKPAEPKVDVSNKTTDTQAVPEEPKNESVASQKQDDVQEDKKAVVADEKSKEEVAK